jgi:hypothetical protein
MRKTLIFYKGRAPNGKEDPLDQARVPPAAATPPGGSRSGRLLGGVPCLPQALLSPASSSPSSSPPDPATSPPPHQQAATSAATAHHHHKLICTLLQKTFLGVDKNKFLRTVRYLSVFVTAKNSCLQRPLKTDL